MRRKIFLLLVLSLLIVGTASQMVSAAEPWDTIKDIVTLKFLGDVGFKSTLDPMEGFLRFGMLIILFALLFTVGRMVKLPKNATIVVSLVLALITAVFIPGSVLVAIGTTYAGIVSIIFLSLPFLLVVGLHKWFKEHRWVRTTILGVTAWLLLQISNYVEKDLADFAGYPFSAAIETVATPYYIGMIIAWVLFGFSLLGALSHLGGAGEHHPNWLGRWVDKIKGGIPITDEYKKLTHARREETRLLNNLAAEKSLQGNLKETRQKLDLYDKEIAPIIRDHKVLSKHNLGEIERTFDEFYGAFDDVYKDGNKWKKANRREYKEMQRLIDELAKKDVTRGTIEKLEKQQQLLNQLFVNAHQNIVDAKKELDAVRSDHGKVVKSLRSKYRKGPGATERPLEKSLHGAAAAIQRGLDAVDKKLEAALDEDDKAMAATGALAEEIKKAWA